MVIIVISWGLRLWCTPGAPSTMSLVGDWGSHQSFNFFVDFSWHFSVQCRMVKDAQMLCINVEMNMGGGKTQKNSKLHIKWREPLVTIFMRFHLVYHFGWQALPEITRKWKL